MAPYVGRNPDLTWLRFVVIGSSVVAPSGDIVINILADGQRFSVALMDGDYIANQAGQVNVISQDLKMAEGHIDILKAIAVADSVKFQMRLRGRSVISVATDDQIDHIRNTLAIYAMFGGDIGD